MHLSIIIVHYNVRYFLEQCLCSVEKALRSAGMALAGEGRTSGEERTSEEGKTLRETVDKMGATAEIFVVDNHSSDGSAEWLPSRFPQVQFILNSENKGFGAANNQALALAKGEYILFLNPDTILPEDCFSICLDFMRSTPGAGAAGLRMIDGSGRFLKESMRGFPTPWVAFCKLTGLSALFPRSARFAGYYLGQLDATRDHPAPILSGACMLARKQALDKTGGFDERFFLYAEDIDLSYRIEMAGYRNYYIAASTIIHFKGESTPKDRRHLKYFYKAMSQFRRKHSRGPGSLLYNALIEPAIWLRAGVQATRDGFGQGKGKKGSGWENDPEKPGIEKLREGDGHEGREKTSDQPPRRTWVCGDEKEAARLRAVIPGRDRISAASAQLADEIIFCEGQSLSFKEIIAVLEKGIPGQPAAFAHRDSSRPAPIYKIHASGTTAAVGSPSKKQMGEVIRLDDGDANDL